MNRGAIAESANALPKESAPAKKSLLSRLPFYNRLPDKTQFFHGLVFLGASYVIVKHGKDIASSLDNLVPSEKQIMEMMKEQQAGMGAF